MDSSGSYILSVTECKNKHKDEIQENKTDAEACALAECLCKSDVKHKAKNHIHNRNAEKKEFNAFSVSNLYECVKIEERND